MCNEKLLPKEDSLDGRTFTPESWCINATNPLLNMKNLCSSNVTHNYIWIFMPIPLFIFITCWAVTLLVFTYWYSDQLVLMWLSSSQNVISIMFHIHTHNGVIINIISLFDCYQTLMITILSLHSLSVKFDQTIAWIRLNYFHEKKSQV